MKKLLFLTNYQNERVQIWAIYVLNQILELCPSLVSNRTALALELLRLALNKKSIELSIVMFSLSFFSSLTRSFSILDTLCNAKAQSDLPTDLSVFTSLLGVAKRKLQPSDVALRSLRQSDGCVCALQWIHQNRKLLAPLQAKLRFELARACVLLFLNANRAVWPMLRDVVEATQVPSRDVRTLLSSLKPDLQSRAAENLKSIYPEDGFHGFHHRGVDFADLIRAVGSPKLRVQSPHRSIAPSSPRFSTTPRKSSAVFTFDPQPSESPAVSPHQIKPMDPRDYGRIRQKSEESRQGSALSQKNVRESAVELTYSVLSSSALFAQYCSCLRPSPLLDIVLSLPEKGEVPQGVYDAIAMKLEEGKGFSDGDLRYEVDCVIRFLVLRLLGKRILGEKDSVMQLVLTLCESKKVTLNHLEVKMLLLGLFYVNGFSSMSSYLLRVIDSCGLVKVAFPICFDPL